MLHIYIKPKLILPVQNCHKGSWKKKKGKKLAKFSFYNMHLMTAL